MVFSVDYSVRERVRRASWWLVINLAIDGVVMYRRMPYWYIVIHSAFWPVFFYWVERDALHYFVGPPIPKRRDAGPRPTRWWRRSRDTERET